ncbi:MAG: hypothetical protein V1807_01100 [Patescibacteria group bacterium]
MKITRKQVRMTPECHEIAKIYATAYSMTIQQVCEAGVLRLLDDDPTLRGFISQLLEQTDKNHGKHKTTI